MIQLDTAQLLSGLLISFPYISYCKTYNRMRALFVAGGYILYFGKWKEIAVVSIITKPSLRETAQHHTMCTHIACAHTYTHTSYNSLI